MLAISRSSNPVKVLLMAAALTSSFQLFLSPRQVHGQPNLLANPHFDDDLSGWTLVAGTATWDSLDANGSGLSGSALTTEGSGSTLTQVLAQCLFAGAGETFAVGASAYVPGGQAVPGTALVRVLWFRELACSVLVGTEATPETGRIDVWVPLGSVVEAPPGTQSVRVSLSLADPLGAGDGFSAHFDDAFLVNLTVFADGFESGDTSAWSAAAG